MGSLILKRGMKPTAEQMARIYANAPKNDNEIDYSDIPPITDKEFSKMKPVRVHKKNLKIAS